MLLDVTRILDRALQGRRPTGVDRVGLAYVGHFWEQSQALLRIGGRWVVFTVSDSKRLFSWMLAPDTEPAIQIRWLVIRNYFLQWQPPRPNSILLNVVHSGLDSVDYAKRVQGYRLRPIYFLHDFIPIAFPEFSRPGEAEKHSRRLRTMLETGHGVIVNSFATGRELTAHADALGVALPPCLCAHLAPAAFHDPAPERPFSAPYFVVLGTIEPRKNHLLLFNLWRELIRTHGPSSPRLIIIGRRGWECEQVLDMLERSEILNGFVFEIDDCDDSALATWIYHAQALLFPSFVEGFGLPLVEALSLGTPVIVSDLPVFRELAGDIPEYLDPLDGLGWRRAVLDYTAAEAPRRVAQKVRMRAWQGPTWAAHFAKVDAFIAALPD